MTQEMVHSNGIQPPRVLDLELFQELRESLGNELGIVAGLYRRFLSNTAATLEELRHQTAAEARATTLHALKGSAAMVGANRVAAVAAELQESVVHAPSDSAAAGLDALDGELTLFRSAVTAHLESLGQPLSS